jgi:hypothetical protein
MVLWVNGQAHVSPLSGDAIRRYPAGYGFPVPFGVPACASCAFLCPLRDWPALAMGLLEDSRPQRACHVPHRQDALGELASRRRERGTVSADPLTSADQAPSKTSQPRSSPLCVTTLQSRLHGCLTRFQLFLASISGVVPYCLFAFTACLRPRDDSRRPGCMETGIRCLPSLLFTQTLDLCDFVSH